MANQYLTTATEALKDYYLPAFNNQISAEPSAFLEMIKKTPLLGGADIKSAAEYGINGGFGMSAEGQATPTAQAQMYKDFVLTSKDMYCDLGLSNKAMELGSPSTSAFFNLYQKEIEGSYKAAKWNMARMLFGNGIGKLGTFSALLDGVTEVTLDDVSKLTEGLAVDFYNVNGATITKIDGGPYRILYVNRLLKKITIHAAVTTTHGGFITNQNSYNREITGLGAIYDTTNVTTLYGHTRATEEWINPLVYDANHDMTNRFLFDVVSAAKKFRDTKIDTIMMGDGAFAAWFDYMEETHTAFTPTNLKYKSGAAGFEVVVGSNTATIVNEPFVPTAETWGVQKDMFEFISTPWKFCEQHTGGAFTLVPGTSYYRALLASYGDLLCKLPGGCIRLTNCENVEKILVTGISVSPTSKTFSSGTAGETQQITVTLTPTGVSVSQVKFTSSDPTIATVSETGLITSVANGTCVIGCSTVDGGFTAYVAVTVSGIA